MAHDDRGCGDCVVVWNRVRLSPTR